MTEGPLLCGEGEKGSLRGHVSQEQNDERTQPRGDVGKSQMEGAGGKGTGYAVETADVRQKVARRGERWTEGTAGEVAVP